MLRLKDFLNVYTPDFDFKEDDMVQVIDGNTTAHFRSGEYGQLLLGEDIGPYSYSDILEADITEINTDGTEISIIILI